ncbi:hypothetical protein [Variovorax sp. 54]
MWDPMTDFDRLETAALYG